MFCRICFRWNSRPRWIGPSPIFMLADRRMAANGADLADIADIAALDFSTGEIA